MPNTPSSTAVTLMRLALALLDQENSTVAAVRLRGAIDAAVGTPVIPPTQGEIDLAFAG